MCELLRFAVLVPFNLAYSLWELWHPDNFDAFEAAQRQRLIDLAEGT